MGRGVEFYGAKTVRDQAAGYLVWHIAPQYLHCAAVSRAHCAAVSEPTAQIYAAKSDRGKGQILPASLFIYCEGIVMISVPSGWKELRNAC